MSSVNDGLKIGLVTDLGRIDDGTFNQYAYEGLMRAADSAAARSAFGQLEWEG